MAQPIPNDIKREWIRNRLQMIITRIASQPSPTKRDIDIALKRYKDAQKSADLEFARRRKLN